MTPKELFEVFESKDIYEMYIWTNWFFRPGRVSCVDCIRTRAMMSKQPPNCAKCGLPSARLIKRTFNTLVYESEGQDELDNCDLMDLNGIQEEDNEEI